MLFKPLKVDEVHWRYTSEGVCATYGIIEADARASATHNLLTPSQLQEKVLEELNQKLESLFQSLLDRGPVE